MAMTAIVEIDVLQAHAVSAAAPLDLGRTLEPDQPRSPQPTRPVLVMCWRVLPESGLLTCRWQTDISAAFGLPPD
jgi:hypothetical protein